MVMSIDVQFVVSGCPYPFGRYADELENECLDPAALLQSEGFRVNPPQAVQLRGRIEVIALSSVGGIGRINCGQLCAYLKSSDTNISDYFHSSKSIRTFLKKRIEVCLNSNFSP